MPSDILYGINRDEPRSGSSPVRGYLGQLEREEEGALLVATLVRLRPTPLLSPVLQTGAIRMGLIALKNGHIYGQYEIDQ
jgi:hypothetical protein